MNRKKVRALVDSVVAQLTTETNDLAVVLKEIKAAHEQAINTEAPVSRHFHYDLVKKVNKALRMVQA
jgi:hypothetical protein